MVLSCAVGGCSSDPSLAAPSDDAAADTTPVASDEDSSTTEEDTQPVDSGVDACASCSLPHASSKCVAGRCAVAACEAGYEDCDGKASNGCEINTSNNVNHCGACRSACTAGANATAACVASKCEITCNTGFVACDAGCCLPPSTAQRVDAGDRFTCAVDATGALKCWGSGGYGKIGSTTSTPTPTLVAGLGPVVTVSGGRNHACAVTAAGAAKCWGHNGSQQLGNATLTATSSTTPVDVTGLSSGVRAIAAGHIFSCALLATGSVMCWGSDAIGDGTSTSSKTPVAVSSITDAKAIAAGYSHACALSADGAVRCWGNNSSGQVGVATPADVLAPVKVIASGAIAITTGQSDTCAVMASGVLKCWGSGFPKVPTDFAGVTDARDVSSDYQHTCYVTTGGGVKCFGSNSYGQLGDGTFTASTTTPVAVVGLSSGVASIHAGDWHTCARMTTGKLKCWGKADEGQLGNGVTPVSGSKSAVPVDVVGF